MITESATRAEAARTSQGRNAGLGAQPRADVKMLLTGRPAGRRRGNDRRARGVDPDRTAPSGEPTTGAGDRAGSLVAIAAAVALITVGERGSAMRRR